MQANDYSNHTEHENQVFYTETGSDGKKKIRVVDIPKLISDNNCLKPFSEPETNNRQSETGNKNQKS